MLDQNLRPLDWESFINQAQAKKILRRALEASKDRGERLDHILLYGPSGLGKSSLARLIGGESLTVYFGSKASETDLLISFGRVERAFGLQIDTKLEELRRVGDFVFIDEIHALDPAAQEVLLETMEGQKYRGPTIIGATTKPTQIITPLRNRFAIAIRLHFYSVEDLATIVRNSARVLKMRLGEGADYAIASRARGTPRVANHLLRRIKDVKSRISKEEAGKILDDLGVDWLGVQSDERNYLLNLWLKFGGGPTGLATLAGSLAEDTKTVSELYEPYLLRLGLIEITSRGRVITDMGHAYLDRLRKEKKLE